MRLRNLHLNLFATALLAISTLSAQVGAPVLGYVPDGGHLRPVQGIAAASAVMPALDSREFARAAVSPRQDYALAALADTGEVAVMRPGGAVRTLSGVNVSPDAIALSPNGSAAALYYAGTRHFQIIKGLPDTAPDSGNVREIDATFLGGAPAAFAISDDADWLAGAWALGVYAFGPHGEVNRLPLDDSATALAFFHASHNLALATATGFYTVADVGGRNLVGVPMPTAVPITAVPINDARFVALTVNNRRAIVAGASGQITAFDLDTGTSLTTDCACTPEGLFAMGRNAFRLNSLKFGAFKLFDADTGEVLFAPLSAQEAAAEGARQ